MSTDQDVTGALADASGIVASRYELVSLIARGSAADVYRARDLLLNRQVALKMLFPVFSSDWAFAERFRVGAQSAGHLAHPNVIPVYDWGEFEHRYFIAMEYIDGEPLSVRLERDQKLATETAAFIATNVAMALACAHQNGVLHRDLKPSNVLIDSEGQVKVADFGLTRARAAEEHPTDNGLLLGDARYLAPEQAQGLAADERSDVYALGVVLYEMLTGRTPFQGDSTAVIAYQHIHEMPVAPSVLEPGLPPSLERIVMKALAKAPAQRYATASTFLADLARASLTGVPGRASPAPSPSPLLESVVTPSRQHSARPPAAARRRPTAYRVAQEKPERKSRRRPSLVTSLVWLGLVALAAGVFFGGRALGYFGADHYFAVPNVQGMTASAAITRLEAVGLRPVVHRVEAAKRLSGKVLAQSPSPSYAARRGNVVNLSVGVAPTMSLVPTLRGLSIAAAETALKKAHLKAEVVYIPASVGEKQTGVVGADPKSGTSLTRGSTVKLDVPRLALVHVPRVSGLTQPEAGAALQRYGLLIGSITTQAYSATVPLGDVVSSTPALKARVGRGTKVNLVISLGPAPVLPSVPPLRGDTLSRAERLLTSATLSYRVVDEPTKFARLVGRVDRSVPRAGTVVRANHPVVLFVWTRSSVPSTSTSSTSTTTLSVPANSTP